MKWHTVFINEYITIEVDYGAKENALPQYKVTIKGKKKMFKGETAYSDMMRYSMDNIPWDIRNDLIYASQVEYWY